MKAQDRRSGIASLLMSADGAVSGGALSEKFGVSRQIIVQDISALKSLGYEILSTHSGYVLLHAPLAERVFKVHHTSEGTEGELRLIVENGGAVFNVFVWHKVYGKMEAKLNISSQHHVDSFMEGVRSGKSTELMNITGGYHYHTVLAESEAALDCIEDALRARGYLVAEI